MKGKFLIRIFVLWEEGGEGGGSYLFELEYICIRWIIELMSLATEIHLNSLR